MEEQMEAAPQTPEKGPNPFTGMPLLGKLYDCCEALLTQEPQENTAVNHGNEQQAHTTYTGSGR